MLKELQKENEPHELKKFFDENGVQADRLAKVIDCSYAHVRNILTGKVNGSKKIMARLNEIAEECKLEIEANKEKSDKSNE